MWAQEGAAEALEMRAKVIGVLAGAGADLCAADTSGNTPLHRAADKGARAVVEALLRLGAGPSASAKDREGCTPVDIARWRGHPDIAQLMLPYQQPGTPRS
eukprot:m51a1_g3082 hypothetical protein (101) ;mRNA; f:56204-56506